MADLIYDPDDPWGWWRAALDNPHLIGSPELPVHEEPPGNGYFRVRRKGSPWEAVIIWKDESGAFYANRDFRPVKQDLIFTLWTHACRNPISEEAYDAASRGEGFEDEPPPGLSSAAAPDDPFTALSQEYATEETTAREFLAQPINNQARADQAAILAKRLAAIAKRAKDRHAIEKEPSLTEGRRIDAKWRGLKEDPDLLSKRIKRAADDYLREQDRLERERQRAAAIEAERLKQEAAEALRRAEGANDPDVVADAGAALAKAKEAERAAAPQQVAAGRTGERLALRTFVTAHITDIDALFQAVKNDRRVTDVLQQIADAAARANVPLPGTERIEERRAV